MVPECEVAVTEEASPADGNPATGATSLRPVDLLLLGYLGFASIVALARHETTGRGWLLLSNGLTLLLVLLLARNEHGRFGRALREIYPILLLTSLYGGLDLLSGGGTVPVHDAQVQRWEATLFGGQPSRDWWRAAPSQLWSLILHGAYFSYYAIVLLPAVLLLARQQLRGAPQTDAGPDGDVRFLLPLVRTLSGGGTVLRIPSPERGVRGQSGGAAGLPHVGRRQLVLCSPFHRRTLRRASLSRSGAGGFGVGWAWRSHCSPRCSLWRWYTARCTTRWMHWRDWSSELFRRDADIRPERSEKGPRCGPEPPRHPCVGAY